LAANGNNLFAGTGGDGVFLSTSNGNSWAAINTGLTCTQIKTIAINGNNIYAGTYGGGVFLSSNNGSNWSATNTGLTNNYVNALITSGTNIFAGTNSGYVFRSTNNGSIWTGVNVTNLNISSLAISGSLIFAGSFGGGVFCSSNNGINWFAINSGLTNDSVTSLTISGVNIYAGTSGGVWERRITQITGINELNNIENKIIVYPNPANNKLFINFPELHANQKNIITIYNIQGQKIIEQLSQIEKTEIDISKFERGIYILKLVTIEKTDVLKFLKE